MRIELFDYELPEELIAQEPAARRDASRLLVIDRNAEAQGVEYRFAELPDLLHRGDLLVVNDARVDPVRLRTRRPTGGAVEVLLLRPIEDVDGAGSVWEAMVRPGRRVRTGDRLVLGENEAELIVRGETAAGRRLIELPTNRGVAEVLEDWGSMPLPPYIARDADDPRAAIDRDRYQTVYARSRGAVAAPTAGLHFTEELLARLAGGGVELATLTLSVGPGTFQPVRAGEVGDHRMEAEPYVLPQACVDAIVAARRRGDRVIGVGTTVVRTLEHAALRNDGIEAAAGPGNADVFIYPGFEFRVVDAMLTNFHLPRSTPILMVAALAGRERLLRAYALAVRRGFRFYSYGDAMLIL
jgi:S-adenosylmethionine:tRNA ribosyltransferase-isomerase